jgi:hypothetical protein
LAAGRAREPRLTRPAHQSQPVLFRRPAEPVEEQQRRQRASKAETAGERKCREMHEARIPVLDQASQARWDAWLDSRCKALIVSEWNEWGHENTMGMLLHIVGFIGTKVGKAERELRDELRKEFADEIANVKKEFNAKIVKMRKETSERGVNVVDLPNPLKGSRKT